MENEKCETTAAAAAAATETQYEIYANNTGDLDVLHFFLSIQIEMRLMWYDVEIK